MSRDGDSDVSVFESVGRPAGVVESIGAGSLVEIRYLRYNRERIASLLA